MRTFAVALGFIVVAAVARAYPLDGIADTGIRRLEGYALAQERQTGAKLSPGALLSVDDIELRLVGLDVEDFDAKPEDPELKALLDGIFAGRDPSYALTLVDISDPSDSRWAGLRADTRQNVGSVGKVITMAGLFHALREAFPAIEDRQRILRTTVAGISASQSAPSSARNSSCPCGLRHEISSTIPVTSTLRLES